MSAAGRETANESSSVKAALDWSTVAIDNAVSSVSIRANLGACTRSTRSALNQHSISTQSALKQHSIGTQTALNQHCTGCHHVSGVFPLALHKGNAQQL